MPTLTYRYRASSALHDDSHPDLELRAFTPAEQLSESDALFFDGFAVRPDVLAPALLAVARVASRRYLEPWQMISKRIAAADPVVTYDGSSLRFESFSACGGVHARLDVDSDGLDVERSTPGTTNVDINPPLASALARLVRGEPMRLRVGDEDMSVDFIDGTVVEKQVPLPNRWVRGFAESQVQQRSMETRIDVSGAAVRKVFQSFPTSARGTFYVEQTNHGTRLSARPGHSTIPISGPERLEVLESLVRHALRLVVYAKPDTTSEASTSWEMWMPSARLTLTLSSSPSHGFSGDGGLLGLLADVDDLETMQALLAEHPSLSEADIDRHFPQASDTGSVLDVLAACSRVGYDLGSATSFRRLLPFGDSIASMNPRLAASQKLVDAGAVDFSDGALGRAIVRSGDHHHVVILATSQAEEASCSCPWYAKHQGKRGPCKHVLAAAAARRGLESRG